MRVIEVPNDGTTDATSAIQAALDSAHGDGYELFLPRGRYRITKPLTYIDDGKTAGEGLRGLHLRGENAESGGILSTIIEYDGPAVAGSELQPIFKLFSQQCIIEGIGFRVRPGKKALCGIDVDKSNIPGALACTSNSFKRLAFHGKIGDWGIMTYGIRIGHSGAVNCEWMTIEDCYFLQQEDAGIYIDNLTMQSKRHMLRRNRFAYAPFGVKLRSGSFTAEGTGFTGIGTCFAIRAASEPIWIRTVDVEHSGRLLDTTLEGAGTIAPIPIKLEDVRFALLSKSNQYPFGVPEDGKVIIYSHLGPLILEGITFGYGGTPADATMKLHIANAGDQQGATFFVKGCHFTNSKPFNWQGAYHTRTVEACYYDIFDQTGKRTGFGRFPEERMVRYP